MDRVNSTGKTVKCLYALSHSVDYPPSILTTLPGILALVPWVLMSAEWRSRRGGRSGQAERERGGGGVSGLFKALVLCLSVSIKEGEAHMNWEEPTCTHTHSSSSRIFTARSSDWQQQTELRASTTERGGQSAGDKEVIYRGQGKRDLLRICSFFSTLWTIKGISPLLFFSWTLSAGQPGLCYGSPDGTWGSGGFPLICLLSS